MRAGERPNHPVELLSAWIDGEIKPAEEAALEAHLEGCAECRGLLEDFRKLDGTIADEAPPPVPADLRERILAGLPSRREVPAVPYWRQAMPLAAAASLLMAVLLWWVKPDRLPPPRPADPPQAAVEAGPRMASRMAVPPPGADEARASLADPLKAVPPPPPPPPASPAPAAGDRHAGNPAAKRSDSPPRLEERESISEGGGFGSPEAAAAPVVGEAATAQFDAAAPTPGETPSAPADEKKNAATEAAKDAIAERLRSLGYVGGAPDAGAAGSAAGTEAKERAQASAARSTVAAQTPEPVAMMRMAQAQAPGLFASPYTVRLVADRRMLVQSGPYACTAAVDDADRRRITAALQESERVRPPSPPPATPEAGAAAADPTAVNANVVISATPEAREVILRLVRERYRGVLEARCGPLPN